MKHDSCDGCAYDLQGGRDNCTENVAYECRDGGGFEHWTPKKWIRLSGTTKGQVFLCPNCQSSVYFIDGVARRKRSGRKSRCEYHFCPWCGQQVEGTEGEQ